MSVNPELSPKLQTSISYWPLDISTWMYNRPMAITSNFTCPKLNSWISASPQLWSSHSFPHLSKCQPHASSCSGQKNLEPSLTSFFPRPPSNPSVNPSLPWRYLRNLTTSHTFTSIPLGQATFISCQPRNWSPSCLIMGWIVPSKCVCWCSKPQDLREYGYVWR